MASPLYTNKTVEASEGKRRFRKDMEQANAPAGGSADGYVQDPSADAILADAKNTLKNANEFGAENNTARLAALPESLAGLRSAADNRGIGRKITEGMSTAGGGIGLASLPALAINPAIGGAMATVGGALALPDYLRREFAHDEDEQNPGNIERGMMALSALPAVKGVSNALSGLRTAKKWKDAVELPHDISGAFPTGPSYTRSAARGQRLMDESLKDVAPILEGPLPMRAAPVAAPRVRTDFSQGPSLQGLRETLDNKENLTQAFSEFDDVARNARSANPTILRPVGKVATPTPATGYSDELARALDARPSPNATAVFDDMSAGGAFGPEQAAFTNRKVASSPVEDVFNRAQGNSGRFGRTGPMTELPSAAPESLRGLKESTSFRDLPSDADVAALTAARKSKTPRPSRARKIA
jgi:hypothetical protein